MKSEFQFFMTEQDEKDFLNYFKNKITKIELNYAYSKLYFGTNFIQLLSSKIYNNQLTMGRIAYMTQNENDLEAEIIFKKMRSYLKKIFKNNLYMKSDYTELVLNSKNVWYSDKILEWLLVSENNELVQFKDGAVKFHPLK